MSITTYSELQTAIGNWLDRPSDSVLTDRIPEFIALAEARLNRVGLLRGQETETDLTTTTDLDYVALPSNYYSPIEAWIELSGARRALVKVQPEQFNVTDSASIPRFWAIDGSYMRFDCLCGDAYTIPFRYVKTFALSTTTTTNYLLTAAPDIYLFASLSEAAPYLMDDARTQLWESKAQRAITEQNRIENKSRAVPLRTGMHSTSGRGNIYSGDW